MRVRASGVPRSKVRHANHQCRHMDTALTRVRRAQVAHLLPGPTHGRRDTESGEMAPGERVEYWQAKGLTDSARRCMYDYQVECVRCDRRQIRQAGS